MHMLSETQTTMRRPERIGAIRKFRVAVAIPIGFVAVLLFTAAWACTRLGAVIFLVAGAIANDEGIIEDALDALSNE